MIPYYYTLIPKLVSLYFVLQKCSSVYVAVSVLLFAVVLESISWKFHLNFLKQCVLVLILLVAYIGIGLCIGVGIERYQAKKELDLRFSDPEMDELKELYKVYKRMDISSEVYSMMSQLATLNDDINGLDDASENAAVDITLNVLERIDTMLDNPFLIEDEVKSLCAMRQTIISMIEDSIVDEKDDFLTFLQSLQEDIYLKDLLRKVTRPSIGIEFIRVLMEKGSLVSMNFFVNLLTTQEGFIQFKQSVSTQSLDAEALRMFIEDQETFGIFASTLLGLKINLFNILEQEFVVDCIQNYSKNYVPELVQTLEGRQQIVQDMTLLNRVMNLCIDALGNIIEESGNHKLSAQQVIEKIKVCTHDDIHKMLKNLGSIEKEVV